MMKSHVKYMVCMMLEELIRDGRVSPHLSAGMVVSELQLRGVDVDDREWKVSVNAIKSIILNAFPLDSSLKEHKEKKEMTNNSVLDIKILDDRIGAEFKLPSYATAGSAGLDLMAMQSKAIHPNTSEWFGTGIAVHIKDAGLYGFMASRSGLGCKHGIILSNSAGIIDSDYTGEIMLKLRNLSDESYFINAGDRVAQLVLTPVIQAKLNIVEYFGNTSRGSSGFGGSGK